MNGFEAKDLAKYACRISIGNLHLPNRAFLAPMAGITDRPMRDIAAQFGAGMVVSEMIASAALAGGQRDMVRKLTPSSGLPHIVQLAGCEAEWLVRGVQLAEESGADAIDINLGCPAKRVTNGYAGSALMRVPDVALRLIDAVVSATELPVTVKMRLGWDEESMNACQIAHMAVEAGARMITVHARTRQQFYKPSARWHLVRNIVDAVSVPVVVNGDIVDEATAVDALEQSGADAVMIGRGAQGRPWIVGQIGRFLGGKDPLNPPQGDDLWHLIGSHYEAILNEYGTELGVRVARKHIGWYLEALGDTSSADRKAVMTCEDPRQVMKMLPDLVRSNWSAAA